MANRIAHIAILVSNLDEALKLYEDLFGAKLDKSKTVSEQGVKAAILSLADGAKLELLEPLPDSNMARMLEKRGEGLHHIAFEVDDVDQELTRLSEKGVELIDKKSRPGVEGMVAFIHPKSIRGVLTELCQED
ncbi:MAG: methylmalonyl-CoA epimerase [Dehalococcoidia bacterium]|nr:MAG: methylmalonyl-CoA epimerase [Dehalococcoidia bacterium]